MKGRNYYPCETCLHAEVCQYKAALYSAQNYIDELNAAVAVVYANGECELKNIHDLPFVKSTNIVCKFYSVSSEGLSKQFNENEIALYNTKSEGNNHG